MHYPHSEAQAYLAAIVESSDDAIISKNLDGIITSWNAAAERMFGYPAEEAVGQHIMLIIPAERKEEEVQIISRLRRGEKIDHFETIRKTRDGRLLNISLTVSPIRDARGVIIGASKVARDITEKKRQEEELRSQREWFQVTLASIGDAVIATDVGSRVTYLNPVAEKLTGWTLAEALGQPLEKIFHIVNEDTRQQMKHPVERVISTGAIQGLANHTMLISRDGTEYSVEDAAAPIRLSDGKLIGIVLVFHDIGARRLLEKQLKATAETLVERDKRKDDFLAMLAHELRNPLAPISNALHLLRTMPANPEMQRQVLDMAANQVNHMVRLLDDLLDISRITHGKIALRRERVNLCDIITAAVHTVQPLVKEHGQALHEQVPDCPIWVNGDRTRLTQLFGNLLNNAMKYTDNGGRIALDVRQQGTEVVVRVQDNGIGIVPEKLPYIFDMFMQVDSSMERSQGGLGIGLTLVRNIAELHGGRVAAESAGMGTGTTFTVSLPILETASAGTPETMHQEKPPVVAGAFKALVVDDNEASAKTLGWMLEAMGHQAELAFNAKSAMETARRYRPDLVLLDIGMPDMNGYEVCRKLRSDPALKNTIFIAQTGWGQEKHLQRSRESGFDYHLTKPISMEMLQKQLESIREKDVA